jgi:response regulator RpfG family c-di-GMP phosphodiesterase
MQIQRRWIVILVLGCAQTLCLLVGVLLFAFFLESGIETTVRTQILADNQLIARQFARMIDEMALDNIRPGTPGWEKLQNLVEDSKLPNHGHLCIIHNETGRLLCHPDIKTDHKLRSTVVGDHRLMVDNSEMTVQSAALASAFDNETYIGWSDMDDGEKLIAVQALHRHGASVIVQQARSSIQAAIAKQLEPVKRTGLIIAVLFACFSFVADILILIRYDSKLEHLNNNLEKLAQKRMRSLMKTRNAVIFGLAKLAESRDNDTGQHLDRIREHVTIIATQLSKKIKSLDEDYIADLALASSLHDIGKVGVPDNVLLKPGKLNTEERDIMEKHAAIGGDCLASIQERLGDDDFLDLAREVAYFHHEKWDGTGYPFGLRGKDIPISARIVAVADVYDALTSQRPYKQAMAHQHAVDIIISGVGTHFDPQIVEAFLLREVEIQQVKWKVAQNAADEPAPTKRIPLPVPEYNPCGSYVTSMASS